MVGNVPTISHEVERKMDKNTGGPAFPCKEWVDSDSPAVRNPVLHQGMTLRDYFAAAALTGIQANIGANSWSKARAAKEAYEYADAMLEVRGG